MPEPIATVTDNFATDFSEISRTWQRPIPVGTKLYDKQALIDLLEAAALAVLLQAGDRAEFDAGEQRAFVYAKNAITKLKEKL